MLLIALTGVAVFVAVPADSADSLATSTGRTDAGLALDEYVRYLEERPLGPGTAADLSLPREFLERLAGRSLRAHYRQERYGLTSGAEMIGSMSIPRRDVMVPREDAVDRPPLRVVSPALTPHELAPWRKVRRGEPANRGFTAPFIEHGGLRQPMDPPDDAELRPVAEHVARTLARKGLVRTTLDATSMSPQEPWFAEGGDLLRRVGLPVDLLTMFDLDGQPVLSAIADWMEDGRPADGADRIAEQTRFSPRASVARFRVLSETEHRTISGLRGQLRTGQASVDVRFGSPVDVLLQLPDEIIVCAIGAPEIEDLRRSLAGSSIAGRENGPGVFTAVAVPFPVSQWGRDNAVAGHAPSSVDPSNLEPAHLLPRFASINEHISTFLPAESLVFAYLEDELGPFIVSPLLFQGGNLMAATHPETGERLLFIGEAEVHRNVALGLTPDQTLELFRIQLGVNRCIVLPAVSFHIDMEMTLRALGGELHAHVLDDAAGARLIIQSDLQRMAEQGILPKTTAHDWLRALRNGDDAESLAGIRSTLAPWARGTDAIARVDWRDDAEAEVLAALDAARFIAAVDTLLAAQPPNIRARLASDEWERRYLGSIADRLAHRAGLIALVESIGIRVHHIPGLGDDQFAVNPINALQLADAVYVPIAGEEALDLAAVRAYRQAYGPGVDVRPVHSSIAQGMYGGLHCMLAPIPAPARDH